MNASKHLPQLDGLRALAVLGVMWHHWGAEKYKFGLPWAAGVPLFFALSGFLITGILLDARTRAETGGRADPRNLRRIWRNFYARRALRLFPAYYLVLALATAAGIVQWNQDLVWHATYLTNYYVISCGQWIGYPSPFWSLAVEEQFYLLWPLLVLLTPRRWLATALVVVTLIGPAFRAGCQLWFPSVPMLGVATPAQFDALGCGALVAWLVRNPTRWWQAPVLRSGWLLAAALLLYVVAYRVTATPWISQLRELTQSVLFALIVHGASVGFRGWAGRLLENSTIGYIGRISYGLYLIHNLVDLPVSWLLQPVPWLAAVPGMVYAAKAAATFGLAALSWHFWERPLNQLKQRVPYSGPLAN